MNKASTLSAFAAGATLTMAVIAAGCGGSHAADPATTDTVIVSAARVVRGDLSQTLTLASEFRPFQEIDVHAKVAGYVKAIYVDVGDRVAAGQLLAVLETPELQDQITQDEATSRRSQEEINRAEADLERAESAHEIAHLGATRLAAVMKERPTLVAQQDIDEAAGRDRVAEAQVSTAKSALAAARQQLAIANANENQARTLFAYARITAPFAGVITHRYADTGAMIQAGTSSQTQTMPVVKLSENSLLRLILPVPESAVARIHVNEPVSIVVPALNKTYPGTVARFADQVNGDTRTMHTEVDVKNADLTLVPGMYANATLTLDESRGVLLLPVQAVDRGDTKSTVMVVNQAHQIEVRDVTLGAESAEKIEVTSGVAENELVVLGNRSQLKPGATVTVKLNDAAGEGRP
jgi:RND family efflux transporter MFP subunit